MKSSTIVGSTSLVGLVMLISLNSAPALSAPPMSAERLPNIVIVLADDLGFGDVGAYNPNSKVPTPNIDRLTVQGMRFTHAHAASTCVPSRYQLMTGRYLFRARRDLMREALIEPGQLTLASLLKRAGYNTAMIGKWHLGFEGLGIQPDTFDYTRPLQGGPIDHGFDSYFGIPASLDVAPYFYIENNRALEAPTTTIKEHHTPTVGFYQGEFWRAGSMATNFSHESVLSQLTDRAVQYLENQAESEQPFFLYFALTAPHPPWLPTKQFRGRSGAGSYGDFVMRVDDVMGRVMRAVEKAKKSEDTIVVFTSDNAPIWYEADVQRYGHHATGPWRGMKADAWEGGHRIPFVIRWPHKIRGGTTSTHLISFTDMLATFARLTAQDLPAEDTIDGFDILPAILGDDPARAREVIIHEAWLPGGPSLAITRGNWKLIPWPDEGSVAEWFDDRGQITHPQREQRSRRPTGQLYNLAEDPGEQHNVYLDHPRVVHELTALLKEVRRTSNRQLH